MNFRSAKQRTMHPVKIQAKHPPNDERAVTGNSSSNSKSDSNNSKSNNNSSNSNSNSICLIGDFYYLRICPECSIMHNE